MSVVASLDLPSKRIYLAAGVRSFHPVDDLYREIRTLRRTNESLRGFDMPVVASGNVAKGGGKFTPRLATFRHGWKVVPEDVSHVLHVSGEQITDEGEAGPAAFDLEPLSASSKVIVMYEPPLAEIIETGVSGLTEEESDRLMEILTIKAQTDKLPADPTSKSELAAVHGAGSWEGATPPQLWGHTDRSLTTRRVGSVALSSEAQVEEIKAPGYNPEEDSLKRLSEKLDELSAKVAKAGASFSV